LCTSQSSWDIVHFSTEYLGPGSDHEVVGAAYGPFLKIRPQEISTWPPDLEKRFKNSFFSNNVCFSLSK
jgi:hypothetical protein